MAQLVAILEERGLVEVYLDDQGGKVYRLTEKGVLVGNMLAMVKSEEAEKVLEALLRNADLIRPPDDLLAP
jgi:DNA-binding PadR family transcriptional regulator